MPDSTSPPEVPWDVAAANTQAEYLRDFVNESTRSPFVGHSHSDAIVFESDDLDPALADLAKEGYATQAIMLQMVRELKALRKAMTPTP